MVSITFYEGYDEDKEYGDYYDYDYEDYDEEDYTENEEDYGKEVYMIFSSNHVSALSAVLDSAILTNFLNFYHNIMQYYWQHKFSRQITAVQF